MKRQNSVVSSSSRRENPPENVKSKTIGCMSGIIHLVCKSHSSRRFLTFGKKQIKNESSFPAKAEPPKQAPVKEEGESLKEDKLNAGHNPSFSREAPRSPTLPADIRRANPAKTTPDENFRTPPALVARLMGLEEGPTAAEKPESVEERRETLLNALQKCDEDLKALKKIIEAVRSTDQKKSPSSEVLSKKVSCFGDKIRTMTEVTFPEFKGEQQPSPVSVLDELTRSPVSFRNYSLQHSHSIGRVQLQKKPGEENTCFYERIMTGELIDKKVKEEEEEEKSVMWSKKAMKESVEEVCRDIAWGEKREIGRIGLALHDNICRDLIDEIVRDLGLCCFNAMPFQACKRRLSF